MLGTVVISSATSWIVLHLLLGDEPLVPCSRVSVWFIPIEFGIYAILGVVGGLVSVAFVNCCSNFATLVQASSKYTEWVQPVLADSLVGLIGWFMPEVLGVGYDYVDTVSAATSP